MQHPTLHTERPVWTVGRLVIFPFNESYNCQAWDLWAMFICHLQLSMVQGLEVIWGC